jgi:hypothetical protein
LSDNPQEAVVSFKTDRGSSYEIFVNILDQLDAAYNEMYGERVGMTGTQFRELRNTMNKTPEQRNQYNTARGKDGPDAKVTFPKNISIAEPSRVGG